MPNKQVLKKQIKALIEKELQDLESRKDFYDELESAASDWSSDTQDEIDELDEANEEAYEPEDEN